MQLDISVPGAVCIANIWGIANIQRETNGFFICKNFKLFLKM